VDSSAPDFADRLTDAIRETGATLAFDAIGGGSLVGDILAAMERAQPPLTSYTPSVCARRNTGTKYLIDPSSDRPS
jgi:hypothetical protein